MGDAILPANPVLPVPTDTLAPDATPARAPAAVGLHIFSETAPLRQVIVHTPGEEMELVSPENKLDLLFDDILFTEQAQAEHQVLCQLFEEVVDEPDAVLQITTLLREAFEQEDARHAFVETLAERLPERNFDAYEREMKKLSPDELHRFVLTGQSPLPVVTGYRVSPRAVTAPTLG